MFFFSQLWKRSLNEKQKLREMTKLPFKSRFIQLGSRAFMFSYWFSSNNQVD
jgi:hypothetical protein